MLFVVRTVLVVGLLGSAVCSVYLGAFAGLGFGYCVGLFLGVFCCVVDLVLRFCWFVDWFRMLVGLVWVSCGGVFMSKFASCCVGLLGVVGCFVLLAAI